MTQEEIEKKAFEVYPKEARKYKCAFGTFEFDNLYPQREGYINALTEINELPQV